MQIDTIRTDEHVFIAGMTGSGKSFLAEVYLAGYNNVIMLDTKNQTTERRDNNEPIWRGLKEGKDFVVVETLAEVIQATTPKVIYNPSFEEQTQENYNNLFKYIYERGNVILWIDELMSVADSPLRYPPYLKALYTRGRSKNVGVWALTQRPVDIPAIATANSTHYFVFAMQLEQDREKMMKVTGMPEIRRKPNKYEFWYYKTGNERAMLATMTL